MKILHVIPTFDPIDGGPYQALCGICQALSERGHEVTIYTTDLTSVRSKNPLNFKPNRLKTTTSVPFDQNGYKVWYFRADYPYAWCFSVALTRQLVATIHTYDIVIIHSLYLYTTQVAAWCCRQAKVPYVIRPHGTLDTFMRQRRRYLKFGYDLFLQKRDLQRAVALHYTSQAEYQHTISLGLKPKPLIIPLGFNLTQFTQLPEPGKFKAKFLSGWEGQLVLYLGRLNFKKGLDLLVEGFAQVAQQRDDIKLVLVGQYDPPSFAKELEQQIKTYHLETKVVFTGPLFGDDKLAAFADATVWVLPSYTENFGVTVVEAMAAGIPIIISNQVALYHEVQAAKAGLIIACEATQVSTALMRLLSDPLQCAMMGKNGKALVSDWFSLEQLGPRLEKAYQQLIAEYGAKDPN
jgi:glycosyltransferase involved in cell wall biosynthesis